MTLTMCECLFTKRSEMADTLIDGPIFYAESKSDDSSRAVVISQSCLQQFCINAEEDSDKS